MSSISINNQHTSKRKDDNFNSDDFLANNDPFEDMERIWKEIINEEEKMKK